MISSRIVYESGYAFRIRFQMAIRGFKSLHFRSSVPWRRQFLSTLPPSVDQHMLWKIYVTSLVGKLFPYCYWDLSDLLSSNTSWHSSLTTTDHNRYHPNMPQKFREYAYDPSAGAAIVAIVCFCLTSALHTWQLVRTRSWSFIPLTIGGYCK